MKRILLIEDDFESNAATFDRDLQSLIHQPDFDQVQGLIIGRFQKTSGIDDDTLIEIIRTTKDRVPLRDVPRYIELYQKGRLPVDRLMSETIALDQINAAFDRLADGHTVRQILVP